MEGERGPVLHHSLDPLLAQLSTFETANDLDQRIKNLYNALDKDGSDLLSYQELYEGLKDPSLDPPIYLPVRPRPLVYRRGCRECVAMRSRNTVSAVRSRRCVWCSWFWL